MTSLDPSAEATTLSEEQYYDGLTRFRNIFESEALSARPRLEILMSAIVFTSTLGVIWSILGRIESIGFDCVWLAYSFLFPLAYHLRRPVTTSIYLIDEFVYRLRWTWGYPEPFFMKPSLATRLRALPVVACGAIIFTGAIVGWVLLVNIIFPIVVRAPYTGGG